eukprot:12894650-Prorocentrum_lima.AAC.1
MPTLAALPPRRGHAVQVELVCHMMKIMQEQGRAVVVLMRDSHYHEQQEVRGLLNKGNSLLHSVLACNLGLIHKPSSRP